jgi:membrane protein DedA with SNARE-associated domain
LPGSVPVICEFNRVAEFFITLLMLTPPAHDALHNLWLRLLHHHHALPIWTYLLLAVMVMVEGPVATLLGAGAAAAQLLNPVLVFISAACGNLTADLMWNGAGRLGKAEWIERHGRWVGVNKHRVHAMERRIQLNAAPIVIIAKLTLFFAVPTLIATGIARVPLRRWFPADILAECIWTGGLTIFGYYFTSFVGGTNHWSRYLVLVGGPMLFTVGIVMLKRVGAQWGESDPVGAHRHDEQGKGTSNT